MNLEGKVAVVTGSGRGIGRAYAVALAQAGCAVVVNDVDGDVAEATADEIAAAGGRVVAEVCAVGSADAADQLVAGAVKAFGHLDIMCTNAGILRDRVLWNMSDEDFDVVIHTHLRGTFTCARAAPLPWRSSTNMEMVLFSCPKAGRPTYNTLSSFSRSMVPSTLKSGRAPLGNSPVSDTSTVTVPFCTAGSTRLTVPGMTPLWVSTDAGSPICTSRAWVSGIFNSAIR